MLIPDKNLTYTMQFQLSVFYNHGYLSYQITSDDETNFHFKLLSAPQGSADNPDDFFVMHSAKDQWEFATSFDKEFQQAVIKKLKQTKL